MTIKGSILLILVALITALASVVVGQVSQHTDTVVPPSETSSTRTTAPQAQEDGARAKPTTGENRTGGRDRTTPTEQDLIAHNTAVMQTSIGTALREDFENTPLGAIPDSWSIGSPGISIGVVDANAFSGLQSMQVIGRAFGGANVFTPVSSNADIVRVQFFLRVDSEAWTSGNGKADLTLRQRGRRAAGGILKRDGQFFYQDDRTRATTTVPARVDEWVEVHIEMDFAMEEAKTFFDGVLTFVSPLSTDTGFDFLDLNSGNASQSGNVSAFFDNISVEEIEHTPVLLATNSAWIKQSADILSGDVIVNAESTGPTLVNGFELVIGKDATTPAGFEVAADTINVKTGAVVDGDLLANELRNNGSILGTIDSTLDLPIITLLPPFQQSEPGTGEIVVPRNTVRRLDEGDYGRLTIRHGGIVVFTGGTYSIASLHAASTTGLAFEAPSDVRITEKFALGRNSIIGPAMNAGISADDIRLFIAGTNGDTGALGATPRTATIGAGSDVAANITVPNGTLWLRQGTQARGTFIGRDIIVGKNVQLGLDPATTPN